jgi:hypothetical protein
MMPEFCRNGNLGNGPQFRVRDSLSSRRSWEVLLKLTRLISFEMAKSSIMQRSNQNKKLHFTKTVWDYLRYRLECQVEVIAKNGVSTILHVRKNGTKEAIGSH